MIVYVVLTILGAAAVGGQSCYYRNDIHSPFYWRNYENICTKTMCETYPWLKCDVAREYIMDQAAAHWPEDILTEIEYLEKYFNTMIPRPDNRLPYHCTGVCQNTVKQIKLERIFTDLTLTNYQGIKETNRYMCIVIGPNIYYQGCGGSKCQLPYGGGQNSYCVPDVTVSMDIWVYCPGADPSCHKVRFDVPLSCSCKKMRCRKSLPESKTFQPNIPPKPVNWAPGNPIDPQGTPLGPISPFNPFDQLNPQIGPINPIHPLFDGIDTIEIGPMPGGPMGGVPIGNHAGGRPGSAGGHLGSAGGHHGGAGGHAGDHGGHGK